MIKYTVKLMLWKNNPNANGHYAIYLKITINRKTSYISTGIYINEKLWDAKSELIKEGHAFAHLYNPDITTRKSSIISSIVNAQVSGKSVSAAELKNSFGRNLHNYFDFVAAYSKEVSNKRAPATLDNYRKHNLRFEQFIGSRILSFEEITVDLLNKYEAHLKETVGNNYINTLFRGIKTMFNAARRRGIISHYPFSNYEVTEYRAPEKEYLTLKEMSKLEKFKTSDMVLKQTVVYFLLGCYSGLRISDWQAFSVKKHVIGGQIRLRAKKNKEWVTMPVSAPLKRILKVITPLEIKEPTINEKIKVIAGKVGINKHLSSHCARHTFAITLCAEQGISSETCAELMGINVKTCIENYYKVTKVKIMKETAKAWRGLV